MYKLKGVLRMNEQTKKVFVEALKEVAIEVIAVFGQALVRTSNDLRNKEQDVPVIKGPVQ